MNRNIIKAQLKGFTLIEIIIAMILSGILLAMAVKVTVTILLVSSLQNRTSFRNNNLLFVHTVFKENFLNSSGIGTSENENIIFNYPDRIPTIISFQPSGIIISNNLSIDTIPVPWEKLQITKLNSSTPVVNKVSFIIHYNDIAYPLSFRKEYTNQDLYNFKIDAN